jgi:hypothetical protein
MEGLRSKEGGAIPLDINPEIQIKFWPIYSDGGDGEMKRLKCLWAVAMNEEAGFPQLF